MVAGKRALFGAQIGLVFKTRSRQRYSAWSGDFFVLVVARHDVRTVCGRGAAFVRNDRRYGICARKNAAIYGI